MKKSQIKWNYGLTEGMFWVLVEQNVIKQMSEVEYSFDDETLRTVDKEKLKQIIKEHKNAKIAKKHTERWANYSEEERANVCSNISSGTKEAMQKPDIHTRTVEGIHRVADKIGQSVSRHWNSMTEDEYLARCKAISDGLMSMSPEAKEISIELMKFSLKLLYSDEHYLEMHRARVKAGMTSEVCSYISKATKSAMQRPEVYSKSCEANKGNALRIKESCQRFWTLENKYKQSLKCQEAMLKTVETKKRNGTQSTSKAEEQFYALLCSMFSEVERQKPYPNRASYHCDFYVKDIDLYIELNYYWEHGGCLYNENDSACKDQLAYWQYRAKDNHVYARAIDRWTNYDTYRWRLAQEAGISMMFIYPSNTKECIKLLQQMKKETTNETK